MKKGIIIAQIIIMFLSFSSCYDYREINDTAMVSGIAIDQGEDSGYIVSVEIIQPADSESSSPKAKVIKESGTSVEDCLKRLVNAATKELQFSHCKLILFSDKVVENGINDLVDYFLRDAEYRGDLFLAVVSKSKALEMLSTGEQEERVASYDYVKVIQNSYEETGSVPPTKLYQFFMSGNNTLLPIFEKIDGLYSVSGCAGLDKGKLYGIIDLRQTQSVLLVSGEYRYGELLLKTEEGVEIPCQIRDVNTKKKILNKKDMTVQVTVECDIFLTTLPEEFNISTEEEMQQSEDKIAQLLTQKIEDDWNQAVKDKISDVFGFKEYLYRHSPKEFEDWMQRKSEGETVTLRTECKVELANFGLSDERVIQ